MSPVPNPFSAPEPGTGRICVPVCERSLAGLSDAIQRAAARADLVEVRLDYLPHADQQGGADVALTGRFPVPLILTLRPPEQGGVAALNLAERIAFWSTQKSDTALFDWELDLIEAMAETGATVDWSRIICSYHDFAGVPADLETLFQRMLATPARILKLAFTASETTDSLACFELLRRAAAAGRELIAIAMGEAGTITRTLGPPWGSWLTYAASALDQISAPGQTTIDELVDFYRFRSLDRDTGILGIMGWPVSHSLSPAIHNAALAAAGTNAIFLRLPVRQSAEFLRRMVHPRTRELALNWRGLSVTAPHKRTVLAQLDRIAPVAEEIGAVNTIVVRGDQLHGYNTDAEGFIAPLQQRALNLRGMRCAVIGAGGAARAAVWALQRSGALTTVFARHPDRARLLGREFAAEFETLPGASFDGFELVVNATPLGTRGELADQTPATEAQLSGVRITYDLVYNPAETAFLREAAAAGCETLGGMEMLVAQAAAQYKLWHGAEPDFGVMKAAAREALFLRS